MITQVKVGHKFINISIAIVNEEGKAIDPVSAEAWCYKVSQIDGNLNLDTDINETGIISLLKQDLQIGFYGASINIELFSETEYIILYKIIFPTLTSITVESLSIDLSKKQIAEIKVDTSSIIFILSTLVENIWSYSVRTLTSFGTLISNIWENITRTLTFGTKDAEIDSIKKEVDKIQPEIISKKDEYKANIIDLAKEITLNTKASQVSVDLIKIETDKIKYILGLSQENYKLTDIIYNSLNEIISAKIKIYASAEDCNNEENEIAIYDVVATYDGNGKLLTYKVIKE